MEKTKLPKEGVLFKRDYSKKVEFNKTYSKVRFSVWNLTKWVGIIRDYKKEKEHLIPIDNFLDYIEKEQYII